MITRWYQIKCGMCRFSESYIAYNLPDLIRQARKDGWIVVNGQQYCNRGCKQRILVRATGEPLKV